MRLATIEFKLDVLLGNASLWYDPWALSAEEDVTAADKVEGIAAEMLKRQCMAVHTIQKRWRSFNSRRKSPVAA
eukprot:11279675-Karenia_brevis.AAC.1